MLQVQIEALIQIVVPHDDSPLGMVPKTGSSCLFQSESLGPRRSVRTTHLRFSSAFMLQGRFPIFCFSKEMTMREWQNFKRGKPPQQCSCEKSTNIIEPLAISANQRRNLLFKPSCPKYSTIWGCFNALLGAMQQFGAPVARQFPSPCSRIWLENGDDANSRATQLMNVSISRCLPYPNVYKWPNVLNTCWSPSVGLWAPKHICAKWHDVHFVLQRLLREKQRMSWELAWKRQSKGACCRCKHPLTRFIQIQNPAVIQEYSNWSIYA